MNSSAAQWLDHDTEKVAEEVLPRSSDRSTPILHLVQPREDRVSAYEDTVLPHLPALRARAMGLTRSQEAAEDLVQEALLKALRSFHQFRPGTNARAWVLRILKNTWVSEWRSRGGQEPWITTPLEDAPEVPAVGTVTDPVHPDEALQIREEEEHVEHVFRAIPERFRDALRLHVRGLSYREIAAKLQVPIGTVMSRLHRARRHAARILGGPALQDAVRP